MKPAPINQYHIFIASPGDVGSERQCVRRFFDEYNRHTAHIWRARFEVVDWENYATAGIGRPQELITKQTLDKYKDSLVLVIGIMAQRFGSPTGTAESGTEEEFNWAMESHKASEFPEIKWFFRKVDKLELPSDPDAAESALDQWRKVRDFRKRMQDMNNPIFYAEYPNSTGFADIFGRDLNQWLADRARPWAAELAAHVAANGDSAAFALPVEFDADRYRDAVLTRFGKLNFEMLDTTGAFYSAVRLWSVFVPQSVRECHQYNTKLLEIPKEQQRRMSDAGQITAKELEEAEQQADRLREEYFHQPLRPVLDVVDEALRTSPVGAGRKLVILGDPGSGKSSLIRYLALRWAAIAEPTIRNTQPIPLVVELGAYARWHCNERRDFIRYLEEGPVWHEWPRGLLSYLLNQSGRVVLLLDGLDEVFDVPTRESVINDIQRFGSQYTTVPIVLTSRIVGYQAQRLREVDFRDFMLQDLDNTQITDFMDRWHEVTFDNPSQAAPKRERLQKAIRESKPISMLAGNPLLLTMMAVLNRNQELPRDRADLYSQASRVLLHQWDTERALQDFPGMSNEIGPREKTEILRRIAAHMQAGRSGLKGNLIDSNTLTDLIGDYLQNELHFAQARAAGRAVVEQLRQRSFILCFVGADSYAFVHRTFLEYFCAVDFVHQFNVAKTLEIDGLIELFEQHCRDDEWREVLRLICGQIDGQFVGRIVDRLATRPHLEMWDGFEPLPELPLAIWCLGEIRTTARLAQTYRKLITQLINLFPRINDWGFVQAIYLALKELGTVWASDTVPLLFDSPKDASNLGYCTWAYVAAYATRQVDFIKRIGEEHSNEFARYGMIEVICDLDSSEETRRWLESRSKGDSAWFTRTAALNALAEKWPDQATHDMLIVRSVQDESDEVRNVALEVLLEKWPDQVTRDLLALRAVQDEDENLRGTALESLAEKWPDQATRELLVLRAVHDQKGTPRRVALQVLAEKWPDQATHDLLAVRAVQDEDDGPRRTALLVLAEKWPNQATRDLLALRIVQDQDGTSRSAALMALADKWPDQATHDLLALRVVQDQDGFSRSAALLALAEKWPDQATHNLLALHAVQDENGDVRSTALQALAEKWPDQATCDLLALRAVQDENGNVRSAALQALAEKRPDQATRDLLALCAVQDPNANIRGTACFQLGRMHSEFGRILMTHDLDGRPPYLDPLEPIPQYHFEKAAARARTKPQEIDAHVTALSAQLGWDVRVGAKKKAVKSVGKEI